MATALPPLPSDHLAIQERNNRLLAEANDRLMEVLKILTRRDPKWAVAYRKAEEDKQLSLIEQISERSKSLVVLTEHPAKPSERK